MKISKSKDAIIIARFDSKSVLGKNIKSFGSKQMIAHRLSALDN
tara:strand:- start:66 stop:197 length:132 start_codon:yes stop_codon:yes gene_type:complete